MRCDGFADNFEFTSSARVYVQLARTKTFSSQIIKPMWGKWAAILFLIKQEDVITLKGWDSPEAWGAPCMAPTEGRTSRCVVSEILLFILGMLLTVPNLSFPFIKWMALLKAEITLNNKESRLLSAPDSPNICPASNWKSPSTSCLSCLPIQGTLDSVWLKSNSNLIPDYQKFIPQWHQVYCASLTPRYVKDKFVSSLWVSF